MIPRSRVPSSRFVGREDEMAFLRGALGRSGATSSYGVLVAGDAGVGKTRLVREFVDEVKAGGGNALVGGCPPFYEADLPYAAIGEALRPLLFQDGVGLRSESEPSPLDHLAAILPELSSVGPALATAASPNAATQSRLFGAVLFLLSQIAAEEQTVLVVEDIHWADRSTLDLLTFLIRNLQASNLLIVGTYRSDELIGAHPTRRFVAELSLSGRAQEIELAPFSRDEVVAHITAIQGKPPSHMFAQSVIDRSEGNPLFIEELVADGGGRPSISAAELLLARLDEVSPTTHQLLSIAAIAGGRCSHPFLSSVTGMEERVLEEAVTEAIAHRLLVVEPATESYAFRHPMLREALYRNQLPAVRAKAHARVAGTLVELPDLAGGSAAAKAARLAYHWAAAGRADEALAASLEAGAASFDASAFADAAAHFSRALDLRPRASGARSASADRYGLLLRAAEAAYLAGDPAAACPLVKTACTEAEESGDVVRRAIALERASLYLFNSGEPAAAAAAARDAAALMPRTPPSVALVGILAAEASMSLVTEHYEDARRAATAALEVARAAGATKEEGYSLNTLGSALAGLGRFAEAREHLVEARRIAEALGEWLDVQRACQHLATTFDFAGDLDACAAELENGIRTMERVGLGASRGRILKCRLAETLLRLGRVDELDTLAATVPLPDADSGTTQVKFAVAQSNMIRGNLNAAVDLLKEVHADIERGGDHEQWLDYASAQCELQLWLGEVEAAETVAHSWLEIGRDAGDVVSVARLCAMALRVQADKVRRLHAAGLHDEAQQVARRADAIAAPIVAAPPTASEAGAAFPEMGAWVMTARCELTRVIRASEASAWAEAARLWQKLPRPYQEAYCRWREAEAWVTVREPMKALPALRRALEVADRLGAGPLRRELERLATRSRLTLAAAPDGGDTPAGPGAPSSRSHALTPRELEVLRCLGLGMSDRGIAEHLTISPKTAAVHVSHIRDKLRAATRADAAAHAFDLGLIDDDSF